MSSLEPHGAGGPQSWTCPSCGSTATSPYCGNCGERSIARVAPIIGDEAKAQPTRSFVGRLHASLRALASPPGQLTADWLRGRRVGYLAPLSLFLWVNVAFFLVQSATRLGILTWPLHSHLSDDLTGWLATRLLAEYRPFMATPADAYPAVFDTLESVHAKSLVVIMIPAFAAAVWVLVLDRRERFRDSLSFATHFFTFVLIWLCALFPAVAIALRLMVASGLRVPSTHAVDLVVTSLEVAALAWYLHVAMGTVFGLSALRRSVTVAALVVSLYGILTAYHLIVFAVTLYST